MVDFNKKAIGVKKTDETLKNDVKDPMIRDLLKGMLDHDENTRLNYK